jgi:hypothetical protein
MNTNELQQHKFHGGQKLSSIMIGVPWVLVKYGDGTICKFNLAHITGVEL